MAREMAWRVIFGWIELLGAVATVGCEQKAGVAPPPPLSVTVAQPT